MANNGDDKMVRENILQIFMILMINIVISVTISSCISKTDNTYIDPDKQDYYFLSIDSKGHLFDRDDDYSATFSDLEGEVIIFINENPLGIYSRSGTLIEIRHYLKPGINTFRAQGHNGKTIYFKIGIHHTEKMRYECIMRAMKNPSESIDDEIETNFTSGIEYILPIFSTPKIHSSDWEKDKESIISIITDFVDAVNQREGEKVAQLLWEGPEHWAIKSGQITEQNLKDLRNEFISEYSSGEIQIDKMDTSQMEFVFGDTIALVYYKKENAVTDNERQGLFLVTDQKNNIKSWINCMAFAKIGGKWIIWSSDLI